MAEVYLARQHGVAGFEKLVAVKLIRPDREGQKQFVEMFIDEARTAAQLDHPNVVQVYDFGNADGSFFLVMEFVHGFSLAHLLALCAERHREFPVSLSLAVMSSLCRGLDYAHRKTDLNGRPLNLIHRDIDTQNVFVSFEGQVKLGDFGLAKASTRLHESTDGTLKGKVNYLSPEMIRGEPLDQRADIFALGVVLYRLLTGRLPFMADGVPQILENIKLGRYVRAGEARPDLPAALAAIVDRAMATDRTARFGSVAEMLAELEACRTAELSGDNAAMLRKFIHAHFADLAAAPILPPGTDPREEAALKTVLTGRPGEKTRDRTLVKRQTAVTVAIDDRKPGRAKPVMLGSLLIALVLAALVLFQTYRSPTPAIPESTPVSSPPAPPPVPANAETTPAAAPLAPVAAVTPDAAVAAGGFLIVDAKPADAELYLNGKFLGSAAVKKKWPAPAATPLLITVKKTGYLPREKSIQLAANETRKLDFELTAALGVLNIGADVGCEATVDGKPAGSTPIAALSIGVGPHQVSCVNSAVGATLTKSVTVTGVQTAKVSFTFLASLKAEVSPWAEIYLDGVKLGTTPLNKSGIKPGDHLVRLVNNQLGKDVSYTKHFEAGATVTIAESFAK